MLHVFDSLRLEHSKATDMTHESRDVLEEHVLPVATAINLGERWVHSLAAVFAPIGRRGSPISRLARDFAT